MFPLTLSGLGGRCDCSRNDRVCTGGQCCSLDPAAGWLRQLAAPAGRQHTRPVVAAEYRLSIDVSQSSLRELLDTHLDLARFPRQQLVPLGRRTARLVRATPAEARALLETEGYFNRHRPGRTNRRAPWRPAPRRRARPLTRVGGLQFDLAAEAPLPEPTSKPRCRWRGRRGL